MAIKYTFKNSKRKSFSDKYLSDPIQRFLSNSTMSGILLFVSALIAILLANSPWAEEYHHIWEYKFSIGFSDNLLSKTLHHWINDGLMAIFFFVVGLELKREIIAGELREFKKAVVPLVAAIGGMLLPALIYMAFNVNTDYSTGWGIPMATDIAFALGIVYLLGDKVPMSLKVFLTALAIVDDLGAVLVIAIFYTSDLNLVSLGVGFVILSIMVTANYIGIRNTIFYGILGIGGVWLAFLMSGVHATIAAVLAAFAIPASVKINEEEYMSGMEDLLKKFSTEESNDVTTLTPNQLFIIQDIRKYSKKALTPLQNLEYSMHPLVAFLIMPIFALANAGVTIKPEALSFINHPIFLGVFFGLIIGKVLGVYGIISFGLKMKWFSLPEGMNNRHLLACGFLAAIGFTMSLFIIDLAFQDTELTLIAKMAVLSATIVSSIIGYLLLFTQKKI
jgi:Na+:H+ antiporter, NhaA family